MSARPDLRRPAPCRPQPMRLHPHVGCNGQQGTILPAGDTCEVTPMVELSRPSTRRARMRDALPVGSSPQRRENQTAPRRAMESACFGAQRRDSAPLLHSIHQRPLRFAQHASATGRNGLQAARQTLSALTFDTRTAMAKDVVRFRPPPSNRDRKASPSAMGRVAMVGRSMAAARPGSSRVCMCGSPMIHSVLAKYRSKRDRS